MGQDRRKLEEETGIRKGETGNTGGKKQEIGEGKQEIGLEENRK